MTDKITPLFPNKAAQQGAANRAPRKAGETVEYMITYLEMSAPPSFPTPPVPGTTPTMLIKATKPPVSYFLSLYDAVGRDYEWQDMHQSAPEDLDAMISNPDMSLYTMIRSGWTHGFFLLDWREAGRCDLAYFGLVPQAVGQGLSGWLLKSAILEGWRDTEITRMTVNTCTLDHPRALAQYQRHGFAPIHQETRERVLTRDWDPTRFP